MCNLREAFVCAGWNLYSLRKNPRFYMSLLLGFLLCWLLTDKTMAISRTYLTNVQLLEPFVWCYADDDSILFSALVMMLMFSAFPRLDTPASYLIFRTTRLNWLLGQIVTVFILTLGYSLMILVSSMVMCIGCNLFVANNWSETATMLSFSPASFEVALTVMRKTVKLTTPYGCAVQIFLLLFQYVLLMAMLQLTFTVLKSRKTGIIAALIINFAGYVLTPDRFMTWLQLPMEMQYYANLLSAWLSPLQHATYTMHNFGYDLFLRARDALLRVAVPLQCLVQAIEVLILADQSCKALGISLVKCKLLLLLHQGILTFFTAGLLFIEFLEHPLKLPVRDQSLQVLLVEVLDQHVDLRNPGIQLFHFGQVLLVGLCMLPGVLVLQFPNKTSAILQDFTGYRADSRLDQFFKRRSFQIVRAAYPSIPLVCTALPARHILAAACRMVMVHCGSTISTEEQTVQSISVGSRRSNSRPASTLALCLFPDFLIHQRLMCIGEYQPLTFLSCHALLAAEARTHRLAKHQGTDILRTAQNVPYRLRLPVIGIRNDAAIVLPAGGLLVIGHGDQHLVFTKGRCNLVGCLAVSSHFKDRPHYLSRFFIDAQGLEAVLLLQNESVRNGTSTAFTLCHAALEDRLDLAAGILGIPLVHHVEERDEVITGGRLSAIHIVDYGNEADALLREQHFCEVSDLQIVTSETAHVLDDDCSDIASFHLCHHGLEARTVEVRASVAVI